MSFVVVETDRGKVAGPSREGYVAFLGIPFAAPPVGERRFAPPLPAEPWTGVRSAEAFGNSAVQGDAFIPAAGAEGPTSEDCLYLNVFTPAADGAKRPVLVFIHGGGFIVGSSASPLYDGAALARLGDQVVVSFNYRLGPFGYLCLGDAGARIGAAANCGALDQIQALRWVRENIAAFGGNPDDVTVFGESAGGTSVLHLMAAPAAEGLFRRAIAQSPAHGCQLPAPDAAIGVAGKLLDALGLSWRDVEKLRNVPAEQIRDAQGKVKLAPSEWLGWFPVRDEPSLPADPATIFASGGGARVPLVVGSNRDEWNLFEPPTRSDLEPIDIAARLLRHGFPEAHASRIDTMVETYRRSRKDGGLPAHDRAVYRAIVGDYRFRIPALRAAEACVAGGLSTYVYLFTHGSPAMYGTLGSCHALELPFVFGTLGSPLQDQFAGTGPAVEALSSSMMRAWTSFAREGRPAGPEEWPRYDTGARATRLFDTPPRVENAPLDEERAAWDGML